MSEAQGKASPSPSPFKVTQKVYKLRSPFKTQLQ